MDNTIIVRRPTTDEENAIGASLNGVSMAMNVLLRNLSESGYLKKDPKRYWMQRQISSDLCLGMIL